MVKVNWERDWTKASVEDISDAVSVLANGLGGVEQLMLEQAAEELWRLAGLES